jgi:hypothetical protein
MWKVCLQLVSFIPKDKCQLGVKSCLQIIFMKFLLCVYVIHVVFIILL